MPKVDIFHDLTPMCYTNMDGVSPAMWKFRENNICFPTMFFLHLAHPNLPNIGTSKHIPSVFYLFCWWICSGHHVWPRGWCPKQLFPTKEAQEFAKAKSNATKKLPNYLRSFVVHKAMFEGLHNAKPTIVAFTTMSHAYEDSTRMPLLLCCHMKTWIFLGLVSCLLLIFLDFFV